MGPGRACSAGALLLPLMVLLCCTHFECLFEKKKSTKPVPFTLTDSVQAASQAADPWLSCVQEVLLQDSTKTHFPESRKVLHPSDSPSELWVVLLRLFVQSGQGAERSGKVWETPAAAQGIPCCLSALLGPPTG